LCYFTFPLSAYFEFIEKGNYAGISQQNKPRLRKKLSKLNVPKYLKGINRNVSHREKEQRIDVTASKITNNTREQFAAKNVNRSFNPLYAEYIS
jgi:hypothetical protein